MQALKRYFLYVYALWLTGAGLWSYTISERDPRHDWSTYLVERSKRPGQLTIETQEMGIAYVREMVAGWLVSERIRSGKWPDTEDDWVWLNENFHRMIFHPKTRDKVFAVLDMVFDRLYGHKHKRITK